MVIEQEVKKFQKLDEAWIMLNQVSDQFWASIMGNMGIFEQRTPEDK